MQLPLRHVLGSSARDLPVEGAPACRLLHPLMLAWSLPLTLRPAGKTKGLSPIRGCARTGAIAASGSLSSPALPFSRASAGIVPRPVRGDVPPAHRCDFVASSWAVSNSRRANAPNAPSPSVAFHSARSSSSAELAGAGALFRIGAPHAPKLSGAA